ncbi:large subunit GTPase 1 [Nematocida displodere]|uniref:Large subunit GTPase 1 n=1 Tax=Nematocida displodere TaxID=1805483 RepID=A0A177EDY4_9MICR|nr:large subunit GTPase 1 [Nematocida displodere]
MKTKYEWGKLVIKDRRMNKPQKESTSLRSVLETTEVDSLIEAAEIVEYDFSQNTSIKDLATIEAPEGLVIPRKPEADQAKESYKNEERKEFNLWKLNMNSLLGQKGTITPYERNLNVWRQLWFTLEESDLVVQIVDSRNPLLFYTEDLEKVAPTKRHLLLLNKADLLTEKQVQHWQAYFTERQVEHLFYSSVVASPLFATAESLLAEWASVGMVGMIGYPNVGKSSAINSFFKRKVVGTSIVPGKTKCIQTLQLESITLCDCPGLVFPSFVTHKQDLILNGILSLDQTREIKACLDVIIERLGIRTMCYVTGIRTFSNDSRKSLAENYLDAHKRDRGCIEEGKIIKAIVKEYLEGKIRYVHPPPDTDSVAFNENNHPVPDDFTVNTAVSYGWYAEEREKALPKEVKIPLSVLLSKKHYLKKGLERGFKKKPG